MMPASFFAKYISVCCPSVPARWSCFAIATRAFATFKTILSVSLWRETESIKSIIVHQAEGSEVWRKFEPCDKSLEDTK